MRSLIAAALAALAVAGCSDPMDRVTRLSEVELSDEAPSVEMAEPASEAEADERGGLFARLFQPKTTDPTPEAAAATETGGGADQETKLAAPSDAETAAEQTQPDRPRGLFGLFVRGGRGGPAPEDSQEPQAEPVEMAALSPEPAQDTANRRRGLFARAASPARIDPNAPDAQLIAPGTVLPYGAVARVCDMPRRDMGQKIDSYPERRAQYTLYDSAPGATGPRSFYMTGFPDGCARQFTAALAMFGSPRMHEQLRYGAPASSLPYSDTDKAYEKIKRQVCGVGRNKPCGARISQLERDTAFVTVYERFGDNARWATILLHDGAVVAADMKSGG